MDRGKNQFKISQEAKGKFLFVIQFNLRMKVTKKGCLSSELYVFVGVSIC